MTGAAFPVFPKHRWFGWYDGIFLDMVWTCTRGKCRRKGRRNESLGQDGPPSGALRSGYSLLELMIALSLLSVLVVLVWSLLSTFTLPSRGERAARIQLLRDVRRVLQSDLEQAFVKGKNGVAAGKFNQPESFEWGPIFFRGHAGGW